MSEPLVPPELLRWQGETDARIDEHGRRLNAINGHIRDGATALNAVALELGKLGTKMAIWSAVGGIIASTVTAIASGLAVYFLTR